MLHGGEVAGYSLSKTSPGTEGSEFNECSITYLNLYRIRRAGNTACLLKMPLQYESSRYSCSRGTRRSDHELPALASAHAASINLRSMVIVGHNTRLSGKRARPADGGPEGFMEHGRVPWGPPQGQIEQNYYGISFLLIS